MTQTQLIDDMRRRLKGLVPDIELKIKAELILEIQELKKKKSVVILGHNYMEPALFNYVPDITGDSLALSRKAAETDKDIIIFCGVEFMAETAKILSPDKLVLLPAEKAGCSLAEGITAADVRSLRERFPGVPVVTYVNTYADVKAECDYCCTSGNAAEVVKAIGSDTIIFLPDQYLASNVAQESGKKILFPKVVDRKMTAGFVDRQGNTLPGSADDASSWKGEMIGWSARCEVHEKYTVEDITNVRKQYPDVVILSHPECSPEVVAASDYAGSTKGMIDYVKETNAPRYLLLTECSMGDNIMAQNPDKEMLRMCSVRCPHMNEITLEQTLLSLQKEQYEITVPEDIRVRALRSVERMIAIG